ncbi:SDR family oxidoreductase [Aureliella helgolandensis]|uniref:3 beta-hydroxysteroid dehydrogenase/Delta 5-->4-isomerase n=1 Tax=Aureliella helgolandensis TaxID=2527968 RepID=A0A518GCV5_9BACT|nr:SDR family oxidoreductase [Aureliella helgolandensis]QDV26431.1 3 beta-hydroxysteroid dehydrogenase/Delta 5-->4-isomerase [Aureliella helgolandensis]
MENSGKKKILLTGATGYIGGRLLPVLEKLGYSVRCLTRRKNSLDASPDKRREIVEGNVLDSSTLPPAMSDIDTAFYFVHSMGSTADFEAEDRRAAENFSAAAKQAGVRRIIYLGGLGNRDSNLSKHLRSRQETGDILRASGIQVIELRASIVIGSGSLSFEMVRALTERLPFMVCPKWVRVAAQPIAIEDMLSFLIESIDLPGGESQVFEIGGPDQVTYGQIMQEYARQRGLRRVMIPVPFLTPYLSSLWLGLVTPLYARVGRKMIDSMKNATVVSNNLADTTFKVKPRSVSEAIARALVNEEREFAETRWSDAFSSGGESKAWGGVRFGSRLIDSRTATVAAAPQVAFAPIQRIGGKNGWYYGNWMWRVRGFLDLLVGGVGLRRGRPHPTSIRVGDTLDFWRVEAFEPNRFLRLRAEMKLPGRAWLEFEVNGDEQQSTIRQTASFDPVGLAGIVYWYALSPAHHFVFGGMLRNLVKAAREDA